MQAPRLTAPSTRFAASYLAALGEGFRRGNLPVASPEQIAAIADDFAGYLRQSVQSRSAARVGRGFATRKVPSSIHWLVDGDTFIGELSLRHELNALLLRSGGNIGYGIRPSLQRRGHGKTILRLGLEAARERGLARVLVTAHVHNSASCRVIEANGGVLENIEEDIFGGGQLCRYWIEIPRGGRLRIRRRSRWRWAGPDRAQSHRAGSGLVAPPCRCPAPD